jgi:dienelactone hydrolase
MMALKILQKFLDTTSIFLKFFTLSDGFAPGTIQNFYTFMSSKTQKPVDMNINHSCILPRATWANPILLSILILLTLSPGHSQVPAPDKVRQDFKRLLHRPDSPLRASFESIKTDSVLIEKGFFYSEATEKVPVLIYKPLAAEQKKLPVVICLHGTGGNKEGMKVLLYRLSKAGFMAVAMDGRYAGQREKASTGPNAYVEAITRAWQNTDKDQQEHPFFYDTAYDSWKLIDYLTSRTDVDPLRLGMMGISKGGIETIMAASVDTRIKVAVPMIALQSFHWSLENDRWQGRAKTIWNAHLQAAKDLGDSEVNKKNMEAFWNKLIPGITDEYDFPSMIRLFSPRPLLLLNTENDQNCPLPGAKIAFASALKAYEADHAIDKLMFDVEPNEPHRTTPRHLDMMIAWFVRWL